MTFKLSSYHLPKFSRVSLTIVLILLISTMVNGTLLNFGKRYEDDSRVIFDQWPKLPLGLDTLNNQKNPKRYLFIYVPKSNGKGQICSTLEMAMSLSSSPAALALVRS